MRRRLTRREKRSRRKKSIILSTLCLLFVMTAGYAAFQTNLNITAKGNIKEPGRVIQSWEQYSNEDFHADYYRENIVSATFLDTNQVANNATESWDVSEDGKGGVKAWVVPTTEDNTKYDLYIGANGGVIANENSSYLFMRFTGLKTVDFNTFDTSNTTNMQSMFNTYDRNEDTIFDGHLTSINFGENFNTSKVINMIAMFQGQINLEEVDLSKFDTRNVTNMLHMFEYTGIITLDLSSFDTSNVTNMTEMFALMPNLVSINFGDNFITSKVTTMENMFMGCTSLKKLNLCSFDTRSVTNMWGMFSFVGNNLTQIKVGPNWATEQADTTDMFTGSDISSITAGLC